MKNKLFISKSINELQALAEFCLKKEIELIAHSFLQFESIPFEITSRYEAIFFGSPRAVDFFLKQETLSKETYIGCVGEMTAERLQSCGYKPDFIGNMSGDVSNVALQFKTNVGSKVVLFPQSLTSNRTVASVFDPTQIIEKSIYKTVVISKIIPISSTYVFTSPSNVEGFLEVNTIDKTAKVIAWGITTANYLKSKNISVDQILKEASIDELIKTGF